METGSSMAHEAGRVNLRTFASASTHKSSPGETNQSPMMLHPHLLVVALTNSHSHVLSWEKRTNAIDHSQHLSDLARRHGLPSPGYFPFTSLSADVLRRRRVPTDHAADHVPAMTIRRASRSSRATSEPRQGDGGLNLATALQYGPATGLAPLQTFIREFTEHICAHAYADWSTLFDAGNTDGSEALNRQWQFTGKERSDTVAQVIAECDACDWNNERRVPVYDILCDGDAFHFFLSDGLADTLLVEEWAYPSALATARPVEVVKRYRWTVKTMGLERKKAIYDVCVEYDIIIAEDVPYFFLRVRAKKSYSTFLRIDTQGRVIRMDTFSKEMLLGWFTCSPLFAERLERMGEISTQAPCGLGQALVLALLSQWTFDGYEFDLIPTLPLAISGSWAAAAAGGDQMVLSAYRRGKKSRPLLSFVPPSASVGMFVWVELYFGDMPDKTDEEDGSVLTLER
ncbi:PLP-dependent transferase [Russula emetica]|nr:PLP-dependent transferase [Russula emetica]